MQNTTSDQVAAFRYGLIAPIVCRQTPLLPGELRAFLEDMANQEFDIPGSTRHQVSVRTLERYLSLYRKGGYDALKPRPNSSKGRTSISVAVLQQAIDLRKQRPERSVEQIIFMLEENRVIEPGALAHSTLARHLRLAGAARKDMQGKTEGYRRFEAEDVHILWQSDFQHTLYLPNPKDPKRKKKAILFAILDDYSRYIVQAQFYWDEQLPRLEDSLKKAILKWGVPEQFYCDNGAVFSSTHLAKVCGKLGIRLSHSRAYRPAGRGKVERLFRFIDTSFKPEAYKEIETGHISTLEELNQALASWIDGYYHLRVHGGTKEKPAERLESSNRVPKRFSIEELTDIFLWEDERKADKTGCVKIQGNVYEVDLELSGKKVVLRYDPFNLNEIQVWHEGKRYLDAVPVDLTRRYHSRVKPEPELHLQEEGLSFFDAANARRQEELAKSPLSYKEGLNHE